MPTLATFFSGVSCLTLCLLVQNVSAHSLGHSDHHDNHERDIPHVQSPTRQIDSRVVDELIAEYSVTGDDTLIERGWQLLRPDLALEGSVSTPNTWLQAAWLAQAEHRFELARHYLDKVLDAQPRHAQAWLLKAAVATVQADYGSAREACRQVSLSVAPVVALACQLRTVRSPEQRADLLNRVDRLSLDSLDTETRAWVWSVKGDAYSQVGDLDQALEAYRRSLTLKPSIQCQASLADVLIRQQRYNDAVLLLEPGREVPALGVRYLIAAQEVEKGSAAQRGADAIARSSQNLHELFSHWIAHGDFRHAREMAMFYLSIMPDPALAHTLAVENYRSQREPEDIALLERAAKERTMHGLF